MLTRPVALPQRLPFSRVLDAYEISRLRPDAHPGPRHSIGNKDDCLHYCLPGIPDIFNGRLLAVLKEEIAARATATLGRGRGAGTPRGVGATVNPDTVRGGGGLGGGGGLSGAPGVTIARWNFEYEGSSFVEGSPPEMALRLQPHTSASRIDCTVRIPPDGLQSETPLVGVCSDL